MLSMLSPTTKGPFGKGKTVCSILQISESLDSPHVLLGEDIAAFSMLAHKKTTEKPNAVIGEKLS